MKLSIAELLSIPALQSVAPAFASVTGERYRDPDFVPTQSVADQVAAYLDTRYSEITPIGKETPLLTIQTPESYMAECNASNNATLTAKLVFRVLKLDTPDVWSAS